MAIDDNTLYGLTGAQIKELPERMEAVKGLARELTADDYNANRSDWNDTDPTHFNTVALWKLPLGVYWASNGVMVNASRQQASSFGHFYIVGRGQSSLSIFRWWSSERVEMISCSLDGSSGSLTSILLSSEVKDNLTSTSGVLSANQGKVLKDMIDAITGFSYEVVQTLPASGQNGKIYLVPIDESGGPADNIYEEYIWVNNAWEMIGTTEMDLTNYVQFSDLAAGLATKQNLLTAGSNIQINNDTISATDTTYSPFTGTDGTTAGTSGLVPAPATTDAGKVLGADGTWVAGGPTVVQTAGTSTTDVMSQNAVTKMIYPNYSSSVMKAIKIIGQSPSNVISGEVSIGYGITGAAGQESVGVGYNAVNGGVKSVAIGNYARATANGSIAIGEGAYASTRGQMDIGTSTSSQYATSYGYNGSAYRLLTGLYDPQSAHDAATKGYVDNSIPVTFTTNEWNALWA